MKSRLKLSLAFLLLNAAIFSSLAQAADNIPSYARMVIDAVRANAVSCGVSFVVAPPNQQTPADYLVLGRDGRVVAHLIDRPGIFTAKNPQGGYNHWIEYNMEWIGIYTPQGKVAGANRYTYGHVWEYNYYCHSQRVNPQMFDQCIDQGFVRLLASRLCQS